MVIVLLSRVNRFFTHPPTKILCVCVCVVLTHSRVHDNMENGKQTTAVAPSLSSSVVTLEPDGTVSNSVDGTIMLMSRLLDVPVGIGNQGTLTFVVVVVACYSTNVLVERIVMATATRNWIQPAHQNDVVIIPPKFWIRRPPRNEPSV